MEFETLTETVIGCAYAVYNKLGLGFWKVFIKTR